MAKGFLPICKEDLIENKIEQLDFVYVNGDAYVDHPSFGAAVITRVLQANGYSVGIIAQPDWKDDKSITILGEPRLGFLVSSGNMDSMVNHYFVSKKHRPQDAYTPGGEPYKRPDHAVATYCNLIRKTYRNNPIIIGGIEASLRRLAHYDYWSDSFKRSLLLDSQADLISYGMGETCMVEIADALNSGIDIKDITFIKGTVYKTKDIEGIFDSILLPTYEEMKNKKETYAKSFQIQYVNTDPCLGKTLLEPYPNGVYVVQNPPQPSLTMEEMDSVYRLPYMRAYHPSYEAAGGIPAITEIKFSLTSNRGCFGGCSFCALTFHQGRTVQVRSHESILEEAELLINDPDFKGYIHDVGGPTANFRKPSCDKQLEKGVCKNKQCLFPTICKNCNVEHADYLSLLRKLRELPKVKKVFIRSGIRFDYLMADENDSFFKELVEHHVSGQLKVAPEHISDAVLSKMGKPENAVYERFLKKFKDLNVQLGKNQFVVPYLMSSHPGSTLKEAIELAEYLRDIGYMPEQVQDFYPTPSTISTVMYYTELDPRTMKKIYTPKNPHEKAMQRALIQYRNPKNFDLVLEALKAAGREDLIGFDKNCLIKPRKLSVNRSKQTDYKGKQSDNKDKKYENKEKRLDKKDMKYENKDKKFDSKEKKFDSKDKRFDSKEKKFDSKEKKFDSKEKKFDSKDKRFDSKEKRFDNKDKQYDNKDKRFDSKDKKYNNKDKQYDNKDKRFDNKDKKYDNKENKYDNKDKKYDNKDKRFEKKDKQYNNKNKQYDSNDKNYDKKDKRFDSKDKKFENKNKQYDNKDKRFDSKDKQQDYKGKYKTEHIKKADSTKKPTIKSNKKPQSKSVKTQVTKTSRNVRVSR